MVRFQPPQIRQSIRPRGPLYLRRLQVHTNAGFQPSLIVTASFRSEPLRIISVVQPYGATVVCFAAALDRARGRDLPGPAGHRTPAGKRGQHSGEYVRILPEHMLAIIVSGAHWWDTGSLGGSSSDRNPSGQAPAWPTPTAPKFLRTDPLNPAYIPQHHPPTIIAYAPGPASAGPGPTAAMLQRLRLATAPPSLGHGQTMANPTPN